MAYDFDTIAVRYDRMNHLMTLGLDRRWRRQAAKALAPLREGATVLDVACGTGDMMLALAKRGYHVEGIDLSNEMLAVARRKISSDPQNPLRVAKADVEHLPYADATFDAVTCAFGVRNFLHLEQGLKEMLRVLKPGGRMVIAELATPDNACVRGLYNLYAGRIIPLLGKIVAGNREAYTYLPESIASFPKGQQFVKMMNHLGASARHRRLTLGVCRLYIIEQQSSHP